MRRPFFRIAQDAPQPLRIRVERRVRFEEVDPLGIVWHGRYPSYFEDARVALGDRYGIGYRDFSRHGVVAPIKEMHMDYLLPLSFGQEFTVEAALHWSEAARLDIEYVIRNQEGTSTTVGYTIQLLMDTKGELLMITPEFFRAWREEWRAGRLRE